MPQPAIDPSHHISTLNFVSISGGFRRIGLATTATKAIQLKANCMATVTRTPKGNPDERNTHQLKVIEAIQRKISSRALVAGEKGFLQSEGLPATMQVSPSTVVDAYDRLVAEGTIYARRGSGFYVADNRQPFAISEAGPRLRARD